ncbi:MAG: carotenoid biosynthesis protein [Methanomicrobiales archaeon]|nr:carotenoid biosynthesis protein [Methanomicrobiales archaeon]
MRGWRRIYLFTLSAIALFLFGLLFVHPDPAYSPVSGLVILLLALPSYAVLLRWLGFGRGLFALAIISVVPIAVEALAVSTGYPYGGFRYSSSLGPLAFGLVPLSVAFAYPPVLIGAVAVACRFSSGHLSRAIPLSTSLLLIADLVIDPAAVHAGLWIWADGGQYYGVPLTNFLGWVFTGAIYSTLLLAPFTDRKSKKRCPPHSAAASLLMILSLWSGYLTVNLLLVPAITGILSVFLCLWHLHRKEED